MWNASKITTFTYQKLNITTRPNASPGLWAMFLLPISLIISSVKHWELCSITYKYSVIFSTGLIITSLIFIWKLQRQEKESVWNLSGVSLFITFVSQAFFRQNITFSIGTGFLSTLAYYKVNLFILASFPGCFTLGEASIFSQSFLLLFYFTAVNCLQNFKTAPKTNMQISTTIIQIGLLGLALIIYLVYRLKISRTKTFFLTTFLVAVFAILGPLHLILRQSALLWIVDTIITDPKLLKIFVCWSFCGFLGVLAVRRQIKGAQKASTATRKIFHLLTVAVYFPGLFHCCSFLYLSTGVVLAIFLFLELTRIANIQPIATHLQNGLVVYCDEKDTGLVAFTPIYLLAGCSLPLWLHPSPCDITNSAVFNLLPLISGLLIVGIGDTAASVVGSKFGRFHWKNSRKTVEGTLACILSQALTIAFLVYFDYCKLKEDELIRAGIGIFVVSVIEAKTDQVDNLVLPLILYIILI